MDEGKELEVRKGLPDMEPFIVMVEDAVSSPHTRVAYRRALLDFEKWYRAITETEGSPGLNRATIQRYRSCLEDRGNLSPSSINQRLSAVRKLSQELADNGVIDPHLANGICRVHGVRTQGIRLGNWLNVEQAQALINSPDCGTLKGVRDRAILGLMLCTGLRRSEVASLTFDHVQQREGRWVMVNLVGKHGRVRTVPIPSWCKAAIDAWSESAGITEGLVFRSVRKGGTVERESMTAQAVHDVVKEHAGRLGLGIAPHDLRRSFAKLARKAGGDLSQIQLTLGHASVQTTQCYVAEDLDLEDAPCDRLGLRLNGQ